MGLHPARGRHFAVAGAAVSQGRALGMGVCICAGTRDAYEEAWALPYEQGMATVRGTGAGAGAGTSSAIGLRRIQQLGVVRQEQLGVVDAAVLGLVGTRRRQQHCIISRIDSQ